MWFLTRSQRVSLYISTCVPMSSLAWSRAFPYEFPRVPLCVTMRSRMCSLVRPKCLHLCLLHELPWEFPFALSHKFRRGFNAFPCSFPVPSLVCVPICVVRQQTLYSWVPMRNLAFSYDFQMFPCIFPCVSLWVKTRSFACTHMFPCAFPCVCLCVSRAVSRVCFFERSNALSLCIPNSFPREFPCVP